MLIEDAHDGRMILGGGGGAALGDEHIMIKDVYVACGWVGGWV